MVDALDALDADPVEAGGGIRAKCVHPAHPGDLSAQNVSIYVRDDGSLGAKCHSGNCDPETLLSTIRKAMPGTPHGVNGKGGHRQSRGRPALLSEQEIAAIETCHAALLARPELVERLAVERRISPDIIASEQVGWAEHERRLTVPLRAADDPRRRPFAVEHYLPPWERAGRAGEPKMRAQPGIRRWLSYPAPELLSERWAVLCEGHIDALAAVSHGIPAVGSPSATFNAEWAQEIARLGVRRVAITGDCDAAGAAFAAEAERRLKAAGIAASIIDLGLKAGGDLTDFLRAQGTFEAGREGLLDLCKEANANEKHVDGARALSFAHVEPERVEFLVAGVPRSMLSLLAGHAGLGKSMLTAKWAADVSTAKMLGRKPADVLLLSAEDSNSTTFLRLQAAGADLRRCHYIELHRGGEEAGLTIPDDLSTIEAVIQEYRIALVTIDPVNSYFPPGANYFRDTDTRKVLGPLARLAERNGCAVCIVAHLSKAQQSEALHRIGGSVAYGASARSVLLIDRDPDDPEGEQGNQRLLVNVKSNVGKYAKSKILRIAPHEIKGKEGEPPFETAALEVVGDSDIGPAEMLARNAERPAPARKIDTAKELVKALLSDHEPHAVDQIRAATDRAGFSWPTVERAKRDLGVETSNDSNVPPRHFWRLPNPASPFIRDDGTALDGTGKAGEKPATAGDAAPADSPVPSNSLFDGTGDGTGPDDVEKPLSPRPNPRKNLQP